MGAWVGGQATLSPFLLLSEAVELLGFIPTAGYKARICVCACNLIGHGLVETPVKVHDLLANLSAYIPASNGLVEPEVKIYDQLKNMTAYNSASNGLVEKRVL